MTFSLGVTPDWVPEACTLPTVEQPLRVAEFDELFTSALVRLERLSPERLLLVLRAGPEAAARAAGLAAREAACCGFFLFTLNIAPGQTSLEVSVPTEQLAVLDAVALRAERLIGS